MLIQMSEQLGITDEQKTEVTNHLAMYMKGLPPAILKNEKAATLATWWIRYIEKPAWMEAKAKISLEFVAGICEFIERYRCAVDKLEEREQCAPRLKRLREDMEARKLLAEILAIKGHNVEGKVERMSGKDVFKMLATCFASDLQDEWRLRRKKSVDILTSTSAS